MFIVEDIYAVMVARTIESYEIMKIQLDLVHSQILSVLTKRVHTILEKSPSYDIKNKLLGGTDRIFDTLSNSFNYDPEYYLNCIQCLKLHSNARNLIGAIMQSSRQHQSI